MREKEVSDEVRAVIPLDVSDGVMRKKRVCVPLALEPSELLRAVKEA